MLHIKHPGGTDGLLRWPRNGMQRLRQVKERGGKTKLGKPS